MDNNEILLKTLEKENKLISENYDKLMGELKKSQQETLTQKEITNNVISERDELQKCEDFYSNLEELTSNETYDGDLYFDDNLNLRSLGSDPTYELVVDLKSERFYIYRPADTKAVWMTLDEIKALVNKVLDDKQIEEANSTCYSNHYEKLLESSEAARIANLISTNSSKFSSKNLAKLSKAVEKVNMERKQFLASALISVESEYGEI